MIKHLICIHIEKDGKHYVLSDSQSNTVKVTSPGSLLDFLMMDSDKPETAKVCWNLFEMFAVLQQQLPTDTINQIIKSDRAWFNDYKIFSSSGKVLSIGHTPHLHDNFYGARKEVNIYGLRQYFPDAKPTNLYEIELHAKYLMTTLNDLGWETNTLSSSIALYDDAVLEKEFIPSIYDMTDSEETDGMLSYCYKMMSREWRSVYKVGHFINATDYDLRSGYPSIIKDFGNTSECRIWHSNKLERADFGVCKGTIHINKDYSPIVNAVGQNVIGSYPDIFTTEQIGYLYHYGIGTFDLEDAYYLKFDHPDDKPFESLMTNLYKMRETGGLHKTLAKNISVGIYGYMGQEYAEKYGKYFNPLYSVMTTTRCAIRVGKFIEENHLQSDLVSVTVDGLLATKDVPLKDKVEIGAWRKEQINSLILSVGHQYLESANKVTKDSYLNTYSSMIEAINKNPNKSYYNDVLLNKNMSQTNRVFTKYPKNGRDLLNNIFESKTIEA